MMELTYGTTDKQKKEFQYIWIISNFKRFRDLSKGSDCDAGSENVIILTKRFCKVAKGLVRLGMLDPKHGHRK